MLIWSRLLRDLQDYVEMVSFSDFESEIIR